VNDHDGKRAAMSTIYLIVCGAEPAGGAAVFVDGVKARGAEVVVFATPAAIRFVDRQALDASTGYPVNSEHRPVHEPRRPRPGADVVVIAPATANTVCKLAAGIADTYALDIASENIALGVPTFVAPYVNTVLARRAPYRRAIAALREEGATIVDIPGHEPNTGSLAAAAFPWVSVLDTALAGQN
jgi:phosphopantothenoylcysteine synthetase/decarboxylase